MNGARLLPLLLVMALAGTSPSCRWFRRSKPAPPPAPKTAPVSAPEPKPRESGPAEAPKPEPPPPAAAQPVEEKPSPEQQQTPVVVLPAPPKPETPKRRGRPAQPKPEPAAPAETPAAAPVPQLRQIFTPGERQEYNQAIDRSMESARRSLAALAGRSLSPAQLASAERVRTFLSQAEEARKEDLLRARNLAERADVLAQDLLKSLR